MCHSGQNHTRSLFLHFSKSRSFLCSRHRDGAFLSYSGWVSHFHIFGNNLAMKHLNPGRDGRPKNSNLPSSCLSAVALAKAVRSTAEERLVWARSGPYCRKRPLADGTHQFSSPERPKKLTLFSGLAFHRDPKFHEARLFEGIAEVATFAGLKRGGHP